jgi:hypothetical protein
MEENACKFHGIDPKIHEKVENLGKARGLAASRTSLTRGKPTRCGQEREEGKGKGPGEGSNGGFPSPRCRRPLDHRSYVAVETDDVATTTHDAGCGGWG